LDKWNDLKLKVQKFLCLIFPFHKDIIWLTLV